jgi:hypothetical protein
MPHSDYLFLDSLIRLDAKRADLPAFPRIDAPTYALGNGLSCFRER